MTRHRVYFFIDWNSIEWFWCRVSSFLSPRPTLKITFKSIKLNLESIFGYRQHHPSPPQGRYSWGFIVSAKRFIDDMLSMRRNIASVSLELSSWNMNNAFRVLSWICSFLRRTWIFYALIHSLFTEYEADASTLSLTAYMNGVWRHWFSFNQIDYAACNIWTDSTDWTNIRWLFRETEVAGKLLLNKHYRKFAYS